MNTAVPGDAGDVGGLVEHLGDRALAALDALGDEIAATPPRRHLHQEHERDQQREPAAGRDLWHVRGEERDVDDQQRQRDEEDSCLATSPTVRGPARRTGSW